MTWRCPTCAHANIWWKNECQSCGRPLPGFEPPLPYAPPVIVPMPPPGHFQGGCAACRLSGICGCIVNPSAPRITCTVDDDNTGFGTTSGPTVREMIRGLFKS